MKKIFLLILVLSGIYFLSAGPVKYPIIYIPGMFDNGDLLLSDSNLVKTLNNEDGFYDLHYYSDSSGDGYQYDREPLVCSSNIVGAKYNRLSVANVIGEKRINISLELMSDRLFCLIKGRAPGFKNFKRITGHKGNDYEGSLTRAGITLSYKGLIEEVWAKYGKKVYYNKTKKGNTIVLSETEHFYENKNWYFESPDKIKFNIVCHSSGGLAIRKFMQLCRKENSEIPVNAIINLSVPQQGARLLYTYKKAFSRLIDESVTSLFNNKDSGEVVLSNGTVISYSDIVTGTRAKIIFGDSANAKILRAIIGSYIIHHIPFDGEKGVLARDPALHDLHPDHRFIKSLKTEPIPGSISIHNYRVKKAYAPIFQNLGKFLLLGENDGAVDLRDTSLAKIPGYNQLKAEDHFVESANHIPFPYIKPLYELRQTVSENYFFLKILISESMSEKKGIDLIEAFMKAVMQEIGFDLAYFIENEDYSVIDYFAEYPVLFD